VNRRLGLAGYWRSRSHLRYYDEVVALARRHEPGGQAVLDVGAGDTEMLRRLTWFPRRVALDRRPGPRQRGVERVVADFLAYTPPRRFDLVLCLQVLEHLEDPGPFARRLLAAGETVIVSVPYRWPAGLSPGHVQDPVDEAKLASWTGCEPVETQLVVNGLTRLIAVYRR
jgi:SAM-dependent methyltransferase